MADFERIYINGICVIAVNFDNPTISNANSLKKIVKEEINSGHTDLIIDLRRCQYIDSMFFGAIIVVARMLIDFGQKLKIVRTGSIGGYTFTQGDYSKILAKYNTREEAIKSFE